MNNLGKQLRNLYVDKLGFLPKYLNTDFLHGNGVDSGDIYVRSTGYVRTVESVQYLLAGLFPLDKREPGDGSDIAIHIKATENM
jgi:acid phosphatase